MDECVHVLGLWNVGSVSVVTVVAYVTWLRLLQASWKKKKEEERSAQADEVEARMQKWLAE